jgi:hypothetical protein
MHESRRTCEGVEIIFHILILALYRASKINFRFLLLLCKRNSRTDLRVAVIGIMAILDMMSSWNQTPVVQISHFTMITFEILKNVTSQKI